MFTDSLFMYSFILTFCRYDVSVTDVVVFREVWIVSYGRLRISGDDKNKIKNLR